MKISIIGDSYATDLQLSWVSLLAKDHDVECLSQPGCSEYKIYKQAQQVSTDTDYVIVSHTSWSRIPVERHPVHTSGYHVNCDLLYADCDANDVKTATDFFENHFWEDFWIDTYKLYRNLINETLYGYPVLHLDFFDHKLGTESNLLDFSTMNEQYPGFICHMNQIGNDIVYEQVLQAIKK